MKKKTILTLILATILMLTSSTIAWGAAGISITGGGWIDSIQNSYYPGQFYDGSYYTLMYVDPPVSWMDAKAMAETYDPILCASAHLATATSAAEQALLSGLMAPTTHNGWMGGFQPPDEMSLADGWEWVTGEPFMFTNWAGSEPNDTPWGTYIPGSEQNLEIYQGSGLWNDAPGAELKHYYIVEYEDCYWPSEDAIFNIYAQNKEGIIRGRVKFRFVPGHLIFQSNDIHSLEIIGTHAQLTGQGTINGGGAYQFKLWVADEVPDTFRMKIWWVDGAGVEHIIYENIVQPIAGGNIEFNP